MSNTHTDKSRSSTLGVPGSKSRVAEEQASSMAAKAVGDALGVEEGGVAQQGDPHEDKRAANLVDEIGRLAANEEDHSDFEEDSERHAWRDAETGKTLMESTSGERSDLDVAMRRAANSGGGASDRSSLQVNTLRRELRARLASQEESREVLRSDIRQFMEEYERKRDNYAEELKDYDATIDTLEKALSDL